MFVSWSSSNISPAAASAEGQQQEQHPREQVAVVAAASVHQKQYQPLSAVQPIETSRGEGNASYAAHVIVMSWQLRIVAKLEQEQHQRLSSNTYCRCLI
jgi:hypothetical protein